MFSFLKNHPFAVEAFFESSVVLTFAVPKVQLEHLIPICLTLDTYDEKWAFLAVAMVQTKDLRPKGFPKILGNDFFLIGYRIFVKYTSNSGKKYRGLYILRSETDKQKMAFLGNLFTHYNYKKIDISQHYTAKRIGVSSKKSDFMIEIEIENESPPLPSNSPFPDWATARKFAGPLPFTFTYQADKKQVLIIQGVRQNWKPKPVKVTDYHISFIDNLKLKGAVLANAFMIKNIPYYWKKGKIEQWSR